MSSKNLQTMSDKLIAHLSSNEPQIFQSTVRLFPPGFPKTEDDSFMDSNLENLASLVEDLSERIE